jgi:hypothetical protein
VTANEISMLAIGLTLGAQSTNALHAYWAGKDARRDQERARRAARRAGSALYLSSFRLYRLQHRRPS